jgi:hypothetical protein
MTKSVRWPVDDDLYFLGRNGIAKCTGLEFFHHEKTVELAPFTSKDRLGRCHVRLPTAAIPEVVNILWAMCRSAAHRNVAKESARAASGVCSTLEMVLCDWQKPVRRRIGIRVEAHVHKVDIHCSGYRTAGMARGHAVPLCLEIDKGRLRLLVWADTASEEPTHVVDLERAREPIRLGKESDHG